MCDPGWIRALYFRLFGSYLSTSGPFPLPGSSCLRQIASRAVAVRACQHRIPHPNVLINGRASAEKSLFLKTSRICTPTHSKPGDKINRVGRGRKFWARYP
jgi:hypothetical protein